jgi:alcohol dehydrogenase YqhD (iron-dependent ADH family)
MDYDEVKRYSKLYAVQKVYSSTLQRYFEERHEMNVFLMRLGTPGKLSDAEFESEKRTILSEKLTILEFQELDKLLNNNYIKLLSQEI